MNLHFKECKTSDCESKAAPKRNYCYKCKSDRYRKKNPIRYAYNNLKQNAKRRGKHFSLSFNEFKEFCIRTEYLNGSGKGKYSYHIDRIDENLGYFKENIQVLSNSENVKKYIRWLGRNREGENEFDVKEIKSHSYNNNVPF